MDKYEYQVKAEEIKNLVASKKYVEAMAVADTIDWSRVKSVMMLTIVSDIYKVNRRYEDSREILLLAYERHPGGRTIVYSLCELSIKMEEFVQAVEYYKEFVQIAPKDTGRYILQYKLYEAQEVSLEERIGVLEEFKKRDYREKWAYELAYLYHRIGLSTRCIEECDELILWFGEGKYVLKAMELKLLHEPLNPSQQRKYDELSNTKNKGLALVAEESDDDEMDIQVKPMDMGKYNTINIQKALAESMKELMLDDEDAEEDEELDEEEFLEEEEFEEKKNYEKNKITDLIVAPLLQETENLPVEEIRQQEKMTERMPEKEEEIFFEEGRTGELLNAKEKSLIQELEPKQEAEDYTLLFAQDKSEFDRMLAQEYDGQISLVVAEKEQLEKQITGQMNINDILEEWENTKKQNQEKRMEDIRKKVLEQTGQLFSEFDEATKSDLLAKLEEASKLEEENRRLKEDAARTLLRTEKPEELGEVEELEEIEEPKEDEDFEKEEPIQEVVEAEKPKEEKDEEVKSTADTADSTREESEESEKTAENDIEEDATTENRVLSEEEEVLFANLLHSKKSKRELLVALDAISLASYIGNVIITGEEGTGTIDVAKNLIREVQMTDNNFSGKVAKVSAANLSAKNIVSTFNKLENGALIIEKASKLSKDTVEKMAQQLEQSEKGIIIVLEDTPNDIDKFLNKHSKIENNFNARINVPQLNNDALVAYAKEYALEEEYVIDELGILALYTRIAEMQTSDHLVNVADVQELIEDAIYHANKKNLTHLMDILLARRYDEEDMVVLRENDFINY